MTKNIIGILVLCEDVPIRTRLDLDTQEISQLTEILKCKIISKITEQCINNVSALDVRKPSSTNSVLRRGCQALGVYFSP
jgi:hypothetical protein